MADAHTQIIVSAKDQATSTFRSMYAEVMALHSGLGNLEKALGSLSGDKMAGLKQQMMDTGSTAGMEKALTQVMRLADMTRDEVISLGGAFAALPTSQEKATASLRASALALGATDAQIGQLQARMLDQRAAQVQAQAFKEIQRATGLATKELEAMGLQAPRLLSHLNDLGGSARGTGLSFAGLSGNVGQFLGIATGAYAVKQLLDLMKSLALGTAEAHREMIGISRAFESLMGGAQGAANEMAALRQVSDSLGKNFYDVAPAYKGLLSAAQQAGLAAGDAREMFQSVLEASTALGLSGERTAGILLAWQQMISKGTVSMEELRRQMGEHLPGAFNMAARSVGMTTEEFNKQVETGKVLALDLLPKLSRVMHEEYGEKARQFANDSIANWERFKQAVKDLGVAIGDNLAPAFDGIIRQATDFLNTITKIQQVKIGKEGPSDLLSRRKSEMQAALQAIAEAEAAISEGANSPFKSPFTLINAERMKAMLPGLKANLDEAVRLYEEAGRAAEFAGVDSSGFKSIAERNAEDASKASAAEKLRIAEVAKAKIEAEKSVLSAQESTLETRLAIIDREKKIELAKLGEKLSEKKVTQGQYDAEVAALEITTQGKVEAAHVETGRKVAEARRKLTNEIELAGLTEIDKERAKLAQEYQDRLKATQDKALVDEWYAAKSKALDEKQAKDAAESWDKYLKVKRSLTASSLTGEEEAIEKIRNKYLEAYKALEEAAKKFAKTQKDYGLREDGTSKGPGWLGELLRPDGGISTEISIGVEINGKETLIPSLVPTLTQQEIESLLLDQLPSREIIDKAIEHAYARLAEGKSPFKENEDINKYAQERVDLAKAQADEEAEVHRKAAEKRLKDEAWVAEQIAELSGNTEYKKKADLQKFEADLRAHTNNQVLIEQALALKRDRIYENGIVTGLRKLANFYDNWNALSQHTIERISDGFNDAFTSWIKGAESFGEAFANAMENVGISAASQLMTAVTTSLLAQGVLALIPSAGSAFPVLGSLAGVQSGQSDALGATNSALGLISNAGTLYNAYNWITSGGLGALTAPTTWLTPGAAEYVLGEMGAEAAAANGGAGLFGSGYGAGWFGVAGAAGGIGGSLLSNLIYNDKGYSTLGGGLGGAGGAMLGLALAPTGLGIPLAIAGGLLGALGGGGIGSLFGEEDTRLPYEIPGNYEAHWEELSSRVEDFKAKAEEGTITASELNEEIGKMGPLAAGAGDYLGGYGGVLGGVYETLGKLTPGTQEYADIINEQLNPAWIISKGLADDLAGGMGLLEAHTKALTNSVDSMLAGGLGQDEMSKLIDLYMQQSGSVADLAAKTERYNEIRNELLNNHDLEKGQIEALLEEGQQLYKDLGYQGTAMSNLNKATNSVTAAMAIMTSTMTGMPVADVVTQIEDLTKELNNATDAANGLNDALGGTDSSGGTGGDANSRHGGGLTAAAENAGLITRHGGGSVAPIYAHAGRPLGWPPPKPNEVDIRALRDEWVIQPSSVRRYGNEFMAALNDGQIAVARGGESGGGQVINNSPVFNIHTSFAGATFTSDRADTERLVDAQIRRTLASMAESGEVPGVQHNLRPKF